MDEAARNLEAAIRRREAAEAALQLATKGASDEEKALAAAQVKQAEATLNQREVDITELAIRAPIRGQITTRVAELGENFSAGAPLFSMIDMGDLWFTFSIREDLLAGLKIGDRFDVSVPAMKSQVIPVRVTMINVQGQYATWRATRATGDFDLRTFEVRAVPIQPVGGLRPGMRNHGVGRAGAATGAVRPAARQPAPRFLAGILAGVRLVPPPAVPHRSDDDSSALPSGAADADFQRRSCDAAADRGPRP